MVTPHMVEKKRWIHAIVFLSIVCLALLQLGGLRALDYSGSAINWSTLDELSASRPTPNFRLGDLYWDVEKYSRAPELSDHRNFFEQNCNGLKGVAAASCLSRIFVQRVPFGEPSNEIFSTNFSPRENLLTHLDGAPGHCVTFSSMTVNSLLSVGIPARFLQTRPSIKSGHNIMEVWDENAGWVAFDSLSDSAFSDGTRFLSAADAYRLQSSVTRVAVDREAPLVGYLADYYDGENPFSGRLIYPEPWAYTRVGVNPNLIVRNRLEAYGKWDPRYGLYQTLLQDGIMLCGAALFFLSLFSLYRRFALARVARWQPAEVSVSPKGAYDEA